MATATVHSLTAPCWGLLLLTIAVGCSSSPFKTIPFKASPPPPVAWEGSTPQKRMAELQTAIRQAEVATDEQRIAAAERILQRFGTEQDPVVRREIVRTMGYIQAPNIAAGLQMASRDHDPAIREAACEAWAQMGGAAAVSALGELLETDADVDVKLAAARALGQLPGRESVGALAKVLTDKDPALQLRAMQSLQLAAGQDIELDVNKWQAYISGLAPPAARHSKTGESPMIATQPNLGQRR